MDDQGAASPTRLFWKRWGTDIFAAGALLALLAPILLYWAVNDGWLATYDILTFFLPWYSELGDRLRASDTPAWMPWLSSGSPFAGDPSGGWWYGPAMVSFAVFNPATAFKVMVLIQTVIGAGSMYALSRLLGLRPIAALMSATAYVFGPFLANEMAYGTVAGQVATWLPLALLAVECSLRARSILSRLGWWAVAGVGISQIAVTWPGQGLYVALLIIAGWIGYRALVWPIAPDRTIAGRLRDAVSTGPAVLILGGLIGAAGLLPRLQIDAVSNIPGGDYSAMVGGNYLAMPNSLVSLLQATLVDDVEFRPTGIVTPVIVLGLLAVLIGRRRFGVPFFAGVMVVAAILSMEVTPVQRLFYLLPGFEAIHTHSPRRILWVCFFAPAMLAGAGLEGLLAWRPTRRGLALLAVPPVAIAACVAILAAAGYWVGWWPLAGGLIAVALAAVLARTSHNAPDGRGTRAASVALIVLVALITGGRYVVAHAVDGGEQEALDQACVGTFLSRSDVGGAGAYLQDQQAASQPFRYVSYAGRDPSTKDPSYSFRRCEPSVLGSLAEGRAILLRLENIEGYDPLHLDVYARYIDLMNGGRQDYHWVDPYPAALESSQLLDMLNVRFIVVGLETGDAAGIARIAAGKREVFHNGNVVIYENPHAFPRAWVVHDVRQDVTDAGVRQLARGEVDGHRVAFVAGTPPEVDPARPGGTGGDRVTITMHTADAVVATVDAAGEGLVVFSEIYEQGWVAYVDGRSADILQTDLALRGVPVPSGEHVVELRYEPASLRIGLWASGLTGVGFLAIWTVALWRWASRRSSVGAPSSNVSPDTAREAR